MRRALPVLALLAWAAGSLAWIHAGRLGREGVYPPGSSYDTSALGTSLARRYLAGRGRRVERLTQPLARAGVPPTAVVFRIRPGATQAPLGAWLPEADEAWVKQGGRLVLALSESWARLQVAPAGGEPQVVFPGWPAAPRPVAHHFTTLPAEACTLAVAGTSEVLVRWPLGQGEVLLLSTPEAIENAGLTHTESLRLLEALAGPGRPAFFDEEAHGLGHDVAILSVIGERGLGPAFVLALLAFLAHAWRERARLGPADPEEEDTRSEAVDLVDSLGLLYERMLDRGEALRLYHEDLQRAVAAQTGLKGPALHQRVRELLGGLGPPAAGPDATHFQRQLAAHNDAFRRLARSRVGGSAEVR